MQAIEHKIAQELGARINQVEAAITLLDEGATVPFISRYRKEVTGGLDDSQLRTLQERLSYLREMEERRDTILNSIREQDKLTPELEKQITEADTKTRLEDLYLPYKPKRRTKAQIAREAGLEPLATALLSDPMLTPEECAKSYLDAKKGVADVKAALDGARQILMEQFSENAELLEKLRNHMWSQGQLQSLVIEGKEEAGAKFQDYFNFAEAIHKVPSHRALAIFRGRKEDFLRVKLAIDEPESGFNACEEFIAESYHIKDKKRAGDAWLCETVRWAWRVKIEAFLEIDLFSRLRDAAEMEAINVFAENLRNLLLASPAGLRATLGLDPGFRSGVKVVVVDRVGKLVDYTVIYPHEPQKRWKDALMTLAALCNKHQVELISIGNGTASRETDQLAMELIKAFPESKLTKLVVSEAGASVYSASELASKEFPDIDVTIRGAVSIARRLQDPLAELVKIDPKSIGVGQYQHDVNQTKLSHSLDAVVEDCVNAVGVDVNSASVALLTHVSGLNTQLANNIVSYREQHGAYADRAALKNVPRMGDKTFEQAAGFLRISNGTNPLDASSVHPEAYPIIEKIIHKLKHDIKDIIGNKQLLQTLNPSELADEKFGIPTIKDILKELEKPGRDPRPEFKTATFAEGINEISDLKIGMILEGVITNVTNFGAFVDIGVHQDGLVHISKLSDRFVANPHDVVKTGQIVKVLVEEVDAKRKRIALSMQLKGGGKPTPKKSGDSHTGGHRTSHAPSNEPSPFASALKKAFVKE